MKNKWEAKLLLLIVISFTIIFSLPFRKYPPAGYFLSPFSGFWQNAEKHYPDFKQAFKIKGIKKKVTIKWDYNMVPHIFASSEEDLIFAQGYATASMRLFQMEYQYRQAAGRLSEIGGIRFLESDRFYRRMGLARAAELSLSDLKNDQKLYTLLQAYCDGINTYVKSLTYKKLPVEYKILSIRPELWTPINILLIQKNLTFLLTGYNNDFERTNSAAILGEKDFIKLFSPVLPKDIPVYTDYQHIKHSESDTCHLTLQGKSLSKPEMIQSAIVNSSNSWAISGRKTSTGKPVLCNDLHTRLKLPGMLFDIQLSCPGFFVYGGSVPGIPFIYIGLNKDIAWGETNSNRDLLDWYCLKFSDPFNKVYSYKGQQFTCQLVPEKIVIRRHRDFYDTVRITKAGPLIFENFLPPTDSFYNKNNIAADWVGQGNGKEITALYEINRSAGLEEFKSAIKNYHSPGLNFTVATKTGDIGTFHQGKFYNHPPLHGMTVMDISQYPEEKDKWIPAGDNPFEINPQKGFVMAANQLPTTTDNAYWYGATMEYYRSRRLNAIISNINQITPESNKLIQNDQYNLMAAEVLPTLLKSIDYQELDKPYNEYYRILKNWDVFASPHSKAMTLFSKWWSGITRLTWDELLEYRQTALPADAVLEYMVLNEPGNKYFNINSTSKSETSADIIKLAFKTLPDKMTHRHDIPEWSETNETRLDYFGIDAFSIKDVKLGGCDNTVNMNSSVKDVAYRMIISLEDEIYAWGIYPGGQSGNPGSYFFNNLTENWSTGNYYDWIILKSENEINDQIRIEQRIQPAR